MGNSNKFIIAIFVLISMGCEFKNKKSENSIEKPEMLYLNHSIPDGAFQNRDTLLYVKSYASLYKGSIQSLLENIADSSTNTDVDTMRMRFMNNPWTLNNTDSIYLLFAGRVVYSGNFNHLVTLEVPHEIMNKRIIAEFVMKKGGKILYFNSNDNYQWYLLNKDVKGVDFIFLTGDSEYPPFYLNFMKAEEAHFYGYN